MKTKFIDHVHELRRRVIWIVLSFIVSGGAAYALRAKIVTILQRPLNSTLYYNSPAGGFNFVMEAAFLIAVFITLPVIIYQIIRFIEPALPIKIKKRLIIEIIAASVILAVLGTLFAFYILIPQSLHFFSTYTSSSVKPLISASEYLDFVANTIIAFAVIFQIPMLILFINRIKPLKPKKILHYQKLVIVGSFVLAVILPFTYSPISQFIVVIPIVFLYYLSIILLVIVNRGRTYEKPFKMPTVFIESKLYQAEQIKKSYAKPVYTSTSIDGVIQKSWKYTTPAFNVTPISNTKPNPPRESEAVRRARRVQAIDGFFPLVI